MKVFGYLLIILATSCLTEANQIPDKPIPNGGSSSGNAGAAIAGDRELGFSSYEDLCADCHDSIEDSWEDSEKAGATFDRIAAAGDIGAHSGIDGWISDEEAENIAAALNEPVESAGEGDVENGIALYAEFGCDGCHNDIEDSAKKGADADRIGASADISSHSGVDPFPEGQDLLDLAAALAE